tara:strand:- start:4 stop:225 length:222 start_codon:yes stop_codon:yes gene_type:complete
MSDNNPLKIFARVCAQIGWDKKLSDLSEEEVIGIISNIQIAKGIDKFYDGEEIVRIHFLYSDRSWKGGGDAPF